MRRSFFLFLILLSALFCLAIDYPYSCTDTENCDSDCDTAVVSCFISGTVQQETECEYDRSEGEWVRCRAKIKGTSIYIANSGKVYCSGCDGSTGEGCAPGSGAWWIGCDPFAY